MKKLLIIPLALIVIATGLLFTHQPGHHVTSQLPQTTVNPVDTPTTPLPVTSPDPATILSPAPEAAPALVSNSGTTLVDIQRSQYPDGTVIGPQFTPTTFWTWNVSWTCTATTQTTQLPSGNYQTTGPSLGVELMIVLPPSSAHPDATTYHLVNIEQTGSGTYSVTETVDQAFYFRVTGNCDWHVLALDNGAPKYPTVEPCTLNELYAVNSSSNHIPASCAR